LEGVWNEKAAKVFLGSDSKKLKMRRLPPLSSPTFGKSVLFPGNGELECPTMKVTVVILLLCQFGFSADPPKFGWKKLGAEEFSLDATGHKDFRLPKGRLLFQFKAEGAIYAGVATAEQYAPFRAGKYLDLANFKNFHCVKTDLIEGAQQCNVSITNAVPILHCTH
jgi:hypothetical protein